MMIFVHFEGKLKLDECFFYYNFNGDEKTFLVITVLIIFCSISFKYKCWFEILWHTMEDFCSLHICKFAQLLPINYFALILFDWFIFISLLVEICTSEWTSKQSFYKSHSLCLTFFALNSFSCPRSSWVFLYF